MPKVIDRQGFVKGWFSYDPEAILNGFKSEASRMVVEMEEWMKTQEEYDPDMMFETFEEQGYFNLVKRAKKYRKRIYNRNAELKKVGIEAEVAKTRYVLSQDEKYLAERNVALDRQAELQDEQVALAWRVVKIYGTLLSDPYVTMASV